MKTLKSIDSKSLLIGGLLASTIFFATGAQDGVGGGGIQLQAPLLFYMG